MLFLILLHIFIQGRFTQSYLSLKYWYNLNIFYQVEMHQSALDPILSFTLMLLRNCGFVQFRSECRRQKDNTVRAILHKLTQSNTDNKAWKCVSETFRLPLTFQTFPQRPSQSGLSTSWQMTFDFTATSDLWSKPSPVTPRPSAPLDAAHKINEGMKWLQTLSTVWALWNLFPHLSFLLRGKVKKYTV